MSRKHSTHRIAMQTVSTSEGTMQKVHGVWKEVKQGLFGTRLVSIGQGRISEIMAAAGHEQAAVRQGHAVTRGRK